MLISKTLPQDSSTSSALDKVVAMKTSKRDFSQVEHLKGIYFKHNSESDEYDMLVLNPYINVK
jgi:hypothetical protein